MTNAENQKRAKRDWEDRKEGYAVYLPTKGQPKVIPYHDELEWLQENVEGFIEIVSLFGSDGRRTSFRMVVNDCGAINDMPFNLYASALYGQQIFGPGVVVKAKGPELIGLSRETANELVYKLIVHVVNGDDIFE